MLGFGAGQLYAVRRIDASGAAVANPTPVAFGVLQDISVDINYEEKVLHGSAVFPVGIGRGKGKIGIKAKNASFNGAVLGDLLFGSGSTAGIRGLVSDFPAAIPATPFQITVAPPASGSFTESLGVRDGTTGQPLTRVAASPTAGQYSVNGSGQYTFAAADTGKTVLISYEYTATSTTARRGTITNTQMGLIPIFGLYLSNSYLDKTFSMTLVRVSLSRFNFPFKNDDFAVPELDMSAFADDAGLVGYWSSSE